MRNHPSEYLYQVNGKYCFAESELDWKPYFHASSIDFDQDSKIKLAEKREGGCIWWNSNETGWREGGGNGRELVERWKAEWSGLTRSGDNFHDRLVLVFEKEAQP